MMRNGLLLAGLSSAAGMLALAAPLSARLIDGWEVTANGDNCVMQSSFPDGVTLALVLNPKSGDLGFMAAGRQWKELDGQRGKPGKIELAFKGDVSQGSWVDEGANVVVTTDRSGMIGSWGSAHSGQLADAVIHASGVSVIVGTRDLGLYDLSGAPAAYRELQRCGKQLGPDQASR